MADYRDNNYGLSGGGQGGYGQGGNGQGGNGQRGNGWNGKVDTIRELEAMRDHFNREAERNQRQAEALDKAITQLRESETQKKNASLDERAALLAGMLSTGRKKDEVVVLVDGSGSMNGSPLVMALDTATLVHKAARFAKTGAKIGMFGDAQPLWISDITDTATRSRVEAGLNTGTDFMPAVQSIEGAAALNALEGKKTHLVVLSDGDLFDKDKSKEALEKVLRQNKHVTVDVFVIGRPDSMFQKLVDEIDPAFAGRIKHHVVDQRFGTPPTKEMLSARLQDALIEAMVERLQKTRAKKPAAPKP